MDLFFERRLSPVELMRMAMVRRSLLSGDEACENANRMIFALVWLEALGTDILNTLQGNDCNFFSLESGEN